MFFLLRRETKQKKTEEDAEFLASTERREQVSHLLTLLTALEPDIATRFSPFYSTTEKKKASKLDDTQRQDRESVDLHDLRNCHFCFFLFSFCATFPMKINMIYFVFILLPCPPYSRSVGRILGLLGAVTRLANRGFGAEHL